ncbi:MAG: sterol desaturase family protein, partial [Halocynthiibacter sp.]
MPTDKIWNFRPAEPVETSPLFTWPPRPSAILRWFSAYWLVLSTVTLSLGVAVFAWLLFLPDLSTMRVIAPGWIIRVWLVNIVPMILLAGGLHLWLYKFKGQGNRLKFDAREQARDNGAFTFRNQVHDNMFWSLLSGVT